MGFFSKPDVPEIPDPPPPAEVPQRAKTPDAAGADAADKAKQEARKRAAANRNVLTGPSGDLSGANTGKKQLGG